MNVSLLFLGAYFHQFGKYLENTSTSGVKGFIKTYFGKFGLFCLLWR